MLPTAYPHVNSLVERLLADQQTILGSKLVGLYLYGSLVTGDYDPITSDVDLLAVIADDLTKAEFSALDQMHTTARDEYLNSEDRLEIAYITLDALRTFRTHASDIAIISPGEPFHLKEAGIDWLLNWYMVQEKGLRLFGADFTTLIEPISKAEYLGIVRRQTLAWRDWIIEDWLYSRPSQAYAIVTLCRALYTHVNGEQVSKKEAALWAKERMPEWANLIQDALGWRQNWREDVPNPDATIPDTRRFVNEVIDRVEAGRQTP